MAGRRYSPEQVITRLKQAEVAIAEGCSSTWGTLRRCAADERILLPRPASTRPLSSLDGARLDGCRGSVSGGSVRPCETPRPHGHGGSGSITSPRPRAMQVLVRSGTVEGVGMLGRSRCQDPLRAMRPSAQAWRPDVRLLSVLR